MRILERFGDGSFKAVIRQFSTAQHSPLLFQKADYEPHMEQIAKRTNRNVLMGEMGHPIVPAWMDDEQRKQRMMCIYEDRVCCRFTNVAFERILDLGEGDTDMVEPIAVEVLTATVKPAGIFAAVFDDVLAYPELYEFSARAFTTPEPKRIDRIRAFITWDLIPASRLPGNAIKVELAEHS
jgi:hypothetical protein